MRQQREIDTVLANQLDGIGVASHNMHVDLRQCLVLSATLILTVALAACSSANATPTTATSPTPAASPSAAAESTATTSALPDSTSTPLPQAAIDRIAFASSEGSIFTINPDGTDLRRINPEIQSLPGSGLSDFYSWPLWSPDNRFLLMTAFTPDINGGFQSSLLRIAAARPNALPELLYRDVPGTTGIGGVAHFAIWHPEGRSVAVIANTGNNLSTFLVSFGGEVGIGLSNGGPVYVDWSDDGSHMLVHTGERLALHRFDIETGERDSIDRVGNGSVSYRVASFSPATDEYLYVDSIDGGLSLLRGFASGEEPVAVTDAATGNAFKWSPDGSMVAYASGGRAGAYAAFTVFPEDNFDAGEQANIPVKAFWWSPDSKKLLLVVPSPEPGTIQLLVYDVESGDILPIRDFQPSPEMEFVIDFFDQYSANLGLWSPDSTQFVFSGEPTSTVTDGNTQVQFEDDMNKIWVFDATGEEEPFAVSEGVFGTWSSD